MVGRIGKVMYAVCVIPEYSEILCLGRKVCKTLYRFIRIGDTLGVAVHRYAPYTLDKLVFAYQLLDHIHIGTVGSIRNGDHLYTHTLTDCKVSVITRSRTKELNLLVLAPRLISSENAEQHGSCYRIVHKLKA